MNVDIQLLCLEVRLFGLRCVFPIISLVLPEVVDMSHDLGADTKHAIIHSGQGIRRHGIGQTSLSCLPNHKKEHLMARQRGQWHVTPCTEFRRISRRKGDIWSDFTGDTVLIWCQFDNQNHHQNAH